MLQLGILLLTLVRAVPPARSASLLPKSCPSSKTELKFSPSCLL